MPAIVAAAAGAAAGSFVAGTVLNLAAGSIMYGVVSGLTSAVVGAAVGNALGLNKAPKAPKFTASAQDRQQMIRSPAATRRVVYGETVVSGPIVFACTTGAANAYLHVLVPLAHGESEAISTVWFGDEAIPSASLDVNGNVTAGRFSGKMRIRKYLGTASQTADADLVSDSTEWTADHRLRGITYLYVRLLYDQTTYPYGLENIKALVQGRKVYDPRTASTAWSDNWALCLRDYLTADYGLRAASDEVDDTLMAAAANLCDEEVTLPEEGTEARYTCNGSIDLGERPIDILRGLLTGAAGTLVYSQGVYRLHGAAYDTPTVTLTEDDLRGPVSLRARPARQDLFNAVRGTFVSPQSYYQPADFPPILNATYETQDGGEQIMRDVELPYTDSTYTAQRIAKIILERGRQCITCTMPCKLTAFKVRAWDTVMVTIAHLGWSAKVFRVTRWTLQPDGGVDLELQEEAADSYSWSSGEATVVDPAPDTTLPSLITVEPPTSLTCYSGASYQLVQADGLTLCRIFAEWTAADDALVSHYEVQWKLTTDSDYQSQVVSNAVTAVYIGPVESGSNYHVRVRAVRLSGALSAWEGPDTIAASSDATTFSVDYADVTGTKPPSDADNTVDAVEAGATVTSGGITFSAGGAIKGGQTDYDTGTGWFLGYSGGQYKLSIGDPSGNHLNWDGTNVDIVTESFYAGSPGTGYIHFDGTDLTVSGKIYTVYKTGTTTLIGNGSGYVTGSTWTRKVRFDIGAGAGTVNVYWEMKTDWSGTDAECQVRKNGSTLATYATDNMTYTAFNRDVAVDIGDYVELWYRNDNGVARNMSYQAAKLRIASSSTPTDTVTYY